MSIKASEAVINNYNNNIEKIKLLDAKNLIRKDVLGADLNFASAEDDFETAINLFKSLADIDISRVPERKVNEINSNINSFLSIIDLIKNYKATMGENTRNEYINRIVNGYQTWFDVISPTVAYCTKAGTDYEALQRRAKESLDKFQDIQKQATADRDEALKEINEVLTAAKKAAAEVGVTQHTTNFKDAAQVFEKNKKFWMWVISGDIVSIILFSFCTFWLCPIVLTEPYVYSFLQSGLPRFTGLFAMFYFLVVATRNYRAQAHNYIVNKNKQNALSTFETFVKAAEDVETKNAVLLQTTKAIFSNNASGYLKNEADDDASTQIIEIVKDVSKLTGK